MANASTIFEIEFSQSSDGRYQVLVRGANGAEARRSFSIPDDAQLQALLAELQQLRADEATLTQIGTALFAAIFQDALDNVYTSNRDALGIEQDMILRLRIPPELEEIAVLPWELMVDPAVGQLALMHASIVRYLPLALPEPPIETNLPLKVLLTGAQVHAPIEIERELASIQAALAGLGNHLAITYDPHLTVAKFRDYLSQRFHIWHFVGHGRSPAEGKDAELLFEDEQGDPKPVSASQLKIYLGRSGVRLVVLNACDSARLSHEMLRGIAPNLVSAQVPAVVAQQFKTSTESARAFAVGFYKALARGMPLDVCLTEGRRAIMDHVGLHTPDWGIPV
ncbi:MAG TPA: CHAT domain-containing protein, partial [Roseiflexaceae bacterium]|nr:CHAT domain-containing protein [Roseiflexaceae bacterium]